MAKSKRTMLNLKFPVGGLNRRWSFQEQPPFTTPDAQNVRPDASVLGRTRGGSRPGLAKVFAAQLGSGDEVRLLDTVQFVNSSDVLTNIAVASSAGNFYRENAGNWQQVSSSLTLVSDRMIQSAEYDNDQLIIADYESPKADATDGAIGGAGNDELTSTASGDFAAAGVNANDYVVVIEDGDDGVNEVQTITVSGSPTGGTWYATFLGKDTVQLDHNATSAEVQYALRDISSIGAGNVTVSGSAGGPWTVTFVNGLKETDVPLINVEDSLLTGGTNPAIAVAETTKGVFPTAGTFEISTVATTTITLASSPTGGALSSVTFRVQRAPKQYDPVANTLSLLTATAGKGQVPSGCPVVCVWNDRVIFAGSNAEGPHIYFMSRQGDEKDWDYGAPDSDVGRAVAGTFVEGGKLTDPITALIPHAEECLVFGCTDSLWIMRGDPALSGGPDNLSDTIGILDKNAWCQVTGPRDKQEATVFLSNDGLYAIPSGCGATGPVSLSRDTLPEELLNIDVTTHTVSLEYDVRDRGVHIYVTSNTAGSSTHFWFDWETKSFNTVVVPNDYEPFALKRRRGRHASNYSKVYHGGRDGYVRRYQHDQEDDDGTPIDSYVLFGPFLLSGDRFHDGKLMELQGILALNGGDVEWSIYTGLSEEQAKKAYDDKADADRGTWRGEGLQTSRHAMARGCAAFIKIESGQFAREWALENILAVFEKAGRVRV